MAKRRLSIVGRDTAVQPATQPARVPLQIIIQPNIDGEPIAPLVLNGEIGVPEDGQTAVVRVDLDARAMTRAISEQITAHDRRAKRGGLAIAKPVVTPSDLIVPKH